MVNDEVSFVGAFVRVDRVRLLRVSLRRVLVAASVDRAARVRDGRRGDMKDGKPVLVTGSPGGSRIISTVLQVIVNVLDYHMDVAAAVAAPRVHHQWLPDEVRIEHGFADDTLTGLRAKGHRVVEPMGQTSANSIAVTPDGLLGAPDPRTRGSEAAGN